VRREGVVVGGVPDGGISLSSFGDIMVRVGRKESKRSDDSGNDDDDTTCVI